MADSSVSVTSSLEALTREYRAITHNLANANTAGFKRTRTSFRQLLDTEVARPAAPNETAPTKIDTLHQTDFAQGMLTQTGRSLDVALEGNGLFVVSTPQGPLYTRAGKFRTSAERQLVDGAGQTVQGSGGPITLPAGRSAEDVTVGTDGAVSVDGQQVGKLSVVVPTDPSQLVSVGAGRYRLGEAGQVIEAAAKDFRVHQGFVESSNVSVVEELVGLITVTRLYEANLKTISIQDEAAKQIVQVAMP